MTLRATAVAGVAICLASVAVWRLRSPADDYAGALLRVERGTFVRQVEAEGTLVALRATPLVTPLAAGRALTLAWLARDGSRVRAGDVVARFDDGDMRRQLADGRSDAEAAGGKLERARVEGDAQASALTLERDTALLESAGAQALAPRDPTVFSRHEIITSELDRGLLDARRETAERKLALSAPARAAEHGLARVEQARARQQIREAERGLQALEVRAPHDGLLLLARDWRGETPQVGRTVWPGERLLEIPDLSVLQARVHVLEADAGGLAAGQSARVLVEGAGGAELAARVTRVDPLAKPRERGSPVRYFETILSLREQGRGFKPGQRVRVTLELERLSGVIAVPRAAVFERDGRRLAYVLRGGRPVAVDVVVGRNSASHVVVEQGLTENDRLLLRDPTRPLPSVPAPRSEPAGPSEAR